MDLVSPESLGFDSRRLQGVGEQLRRQYIEPGKLPGCITLVARAGEVCYLDVAGLRDIERAEPMTEDTLFRLFSMSKPITVAALMTLWEQGRFLLEDPVASYIPEFAGLEVWQAGSYPDYQTTPCQRPMTIRDLLLHMSGLTYDFLRDNPVDEAYRALNVGNPQPGLTLQEMVGQLAQLPLIFSPGAHWNYSLGVDVAGYLVEVLSGMSLADYLQEQLFTPLGMADTTFNLREDQQARFSSCYFQHPSKGMILSDDGQNTQFRDRSFYSGGGGLLSTTLDYFRFCQMLANGGVLDGQQVLGSRTVDFMTSNHLPGDVDLRQVAVGTFQETAYDGIGFGLGVATQLDAIAAGGPMTPGSYFWGGLAGTQFWVDPEEELTVVFMTQLMPASTYRIRPRLEALVYAALR